MTGRQQPQASGTSARDTATQDEERRHLEACLKTIDRNLDATGRRVRACAREIKETKEYMWEARRDLDHIDKAALRQMIEQKTRETAVLSDRHKKLEKLKASPYFGRFDFAREGQDEAAPYYVGVHDFEDADSGKTIVYDWRAPVSSIFYDYETGPARYEAPGGEVTGIVERKRQFRIRYGRMELMLETSVNIVDDLLQDELGRTSDEGMRNIVATIQRDQNAIIRNADAETLIIQGVAGSGKTAIALHRIAFLLYRFKDTLSSADILILSPNKVFADYIGNVLPELGEEQVGEIGMEALADALLSGKFRFESFFEQTARLTEQEDAALRERVAFKAGTDLLKSIDRYVEHVEAGAFTPQDWKLSRGVIVPGWFFQDAWRKYRGRPLSERVAETVAAAEHQLGIHYNRDLRTQERGALREHVRSMIAWPSLRQAYKGFYAWIERPDLFSPHRGRLEYADVFPLIHLKLRMEGIDNPFAGVRHLLVDEMQDYTPVQYAVLARLFTCRKTVLGDATQSVNPWAASTADDIRAVLGGSEPVRLTRSYRSSWEIMQLALAIAPNAQMQPIERHGTPPDIETHATPRAATARIAELVEEFEASDHRSLAIIVKTQKTAKKLHASLTEAGHHTSLLDADTAGLPSGAVVCTAHLAKGLEFDRVIVADADAKTYRTELDRNLLYIACTRAMHRLTLIAHGQPSAFLPER